MKLKYIVLKEGQEWQSEEQNGWVVDKVKEEPRGIGVLLRWNDYSGQLGQIAKAAGVSAANPIRSSGFSNP